MSGGGYSRSEGSEAGARTSVPVILSERSESEDPCQLESALFTKWGSLDAPHPSGARLAQDDRGRMSLGGGLCRKTKTDVAIGPGGFDRHVGVGQQCRDAIHPSGDSLLAMTHAHAKARRNTPTDCASETALGARG